MSKRQVEQADQAIKSSNRRLLRYLSSRLPNQQGAQDLAQEAYLRLLRRRLADLIKDPEAYLFRIATNLIHEYWLKAEIERGAVSDREDIELLAQGPSSLDSNIADNQKMEALIRILKVLPAMQRDVVLLHRRDGLTYAEIATRLDTSPDMVKKYLAKGLARCRVQLQRYYDE
jgi:RNA polymerase sigma-70 factor (ECF subfamily)